MATQPSKLSTGNLRCYWLEKNRKLKEKSVVLKIVTIVGTRPQLIKAAAVSRLLRTTGVREILAHTGQHYDDNMSQIFFEELDIPKPDYNLKIGSATHGAQTGRMLEAIEQILQAENPDWVIVYGDTNSTLSGALAAAKLHIPIAHIEAGLRSFNRRMPEEINRVLTDHTSDLLFAPTETAVKNLRREGVPEAKIHLVGDVMYDAAVYYGAKAQAHSCILRQLRIEPKGYILATIHRAENTDSRDRLNAIFKGLATVAQKIPVVVPIHPRTRAALQRQELLEVVSQDVILIEPVGYLDMIMLEKNAMAIATDSGGVQKEAYFYGVPCAILREETEWIELLEIGWNRLVSPVDARVVSNCLLDLIRAQSCDRTSCELKATGGAAAQISWLLKNAEAL